MDKERELEARLRAIVSRQSEIISVLKAMSELKMPDCWLAAGAVRNTVWRFLYGDDCHLGINDFDVVFFDAKTGREIEQQAKAALSKQFPNLEFDVKNQDSFGNWREWRYRFTSTIDGVAHFLHTATAIAVRLNEQDEIECAAPYGLEDLFDGLIRATPFWREDAEKKSEVFLSSCTKLKKVDSGSSVS